ncbi:hypothetical protein F5141DRAFT_1127786 [Pisolithus sp. B1]|nr:hypothetical protein F5141DRAFT_1127786 [Pisolithus sp. B1]
MPNKTLVIVFSSWYGTLLVRSSNAVIPNDQMSLLAVAGIAPLASTNSGAIQYKEPPHGEFTVMVRDELTWTESPKSVRRARPFWSIRTLSYRIDN